MGNKILIYFTFFFLKKKKKKKKSYYKIKRKIGHDMLKIILLIT